MQEKKIKYDTKGRKLLQDWLSGQNISTYKLTKLVEGQYQNVRSWVIGERRPSYHYAGVLCDITEGHVPIESWSLLRQAAKGPKDTKHQPNRTNDDQHATKCKRLSKTGK